MALGIEMLLGSLGFDPDELKSQMVATKAQVEQVVKNFNDRLTAVETKQDRIIELLERRNEDGGRDRTGHDAAKQRRVNGTAG